MDYILDHWPLIAAALGVIILLACYRWVLALFGMDLKGRWWRAVYYAAVAAPSAVGSACTPRRREKNATMSPKSSIAAMFAANLTGVKCGVDFHADSGTTT